MYRGVPPIMETKVCEVCAVEVSKYCCPGCGRKTCSLKCVKEHKVEYACDGLKGIPTAPEAADGPEKYTEALFMKDYNFLENVSTYAGQLEHKNSGEDVKTAVSSDRRKKILEFKRIQRAGKLAELRLLPDGFSRSKKNQTHFKSTDDTDVDEVSNEPVKKTSRRGKIYWTLDFVKHDGGTLLETRSNVPDDTVLRDLVPQNTKRIFLKNETMKLKEVEKWKEISEADWNKRLADVLIGARIFEYPVFGLE